MPIPILGAIGPLAKLGLSILEKIDPKLRETVRRIKAIGFGEKYIFKNEDLMEFLQMKAKLSKRDKNKVKYLKTRLRQYKKAYFEYS